MSGIQWDRDTGKYTPIPERNEAMNKKRLKKLLKGQAQDQLQGTRMPEAASVFPATGWQSMAPATGALRPVGSTVPANQVPSSVPGMTASLQGGQSAYQVPAESGIDLTPKARKMVERELKKRVEMLSTLKQRAALLREKQPNNPWALSGSATASRNERRAQNTAAEPGGSVVKAILEIDPAEIAASLRDVSAALGIQDSAARWQPQQIDALQQLRNIMSGAPPESLSGAQDASVAGVGGPAARLGQLVKTEDLSDIAAAEQALRKAEAAGDSVGFTRASERLTFLRLRAAARLEGF